MFMVVIEIHSTSKFASSCEKPYISNLKFYVGFNERSQICPLTNCFHETYLTKEIHMDIYFFNSRKHQALDPPHTRESLIEVVNSGGGYHIHSRVRNTV